MNSSTGRIIYANPLRKLDLLFSVFDNYSRPFDVVCFVLIVLAVACRVLAALGQARAGRSCCR